MSADEGVTVLMSPPIGWFFAAMWGAIWGSFANVAVYRLGREDAALSMLVSPPSHCPHCNAPVRARDNVPILGWILLGGRCRSCRAPISIRYPIVEAGSTLQALAVYQAVVVDHPDAAPLMLCRFLIYFFFVATLGVLALIDLDTMLIPDAITLPGIPFFLVAGRVFHDVTLLDAVLGAAVGFGGIKALQIGYARFARREGMGGGDATLMALVGGFLGWRSLPFTLGLGATIGTLVTVPLLLLRRRKEEPTAPTATEGEPSEGGEPGSIRHVEVPFGPFLVLGALAYLFFKDAAWAWFVAYEDR